jgi:hypothetical protein
MVDCWNLRAAIFAAGGRQRLKLVEARAAFKSKITDITGKKTGKGRDQEKQVLTGLFRHRPPGTPDITGEKKIKDLTFDFCCANKVLMINKKGNGDTIRRYRCLF